MMIATALNHPLLRKLKSLPGLVLSTAFSAVLVYGITRLPIIDQDIYHLAKDYRNTTQAVLNLLAGIFSIWQFYVLKSIINFEAETQLLAPSPPTLERRKWWKSLAAQKIDLSLPLKFYPPMIVVWGLALLPSFLWTGALTPNIVTGNVTVPIALPFYPPDPERQSWNVTWTPMASHNVTRTPWGSFSYTPAFNRGNSMIYTAAGVIAEKDSLGTRPRSDKTGYTYTNRSYGVGSSMGLDRNFSSGYDQPTTFQYQEIGYHANVHCGRNTSSGWKILGHSGEGPGQFVPTLYLVGGAMPDQSVNWQLQYSTVNDSNVVSIDARPQLGLTGIATVAITTGNGSYSPLNQSQCSVGFAPTLFDVSVNLTSNQISVRNASSASDMDPTAQTNATFTAWNCKNLPASLENISIDSNTITDCGEYTAQGQPGLGSIATRALRQLNDLSTLDSSLRISELGEMFLSLIENEIQFNANASLDIEDFVGERLVSSNPDQGTVNYSMEQGLKSLIDDSLLAFASAQLVFNYNTSTKPTNGTLIVGAVKFGTTGWVYSLFAFNVILIIIFIEEVIRTHFWAALPAYNHEDLDSVIRASSMNKIKLGKGVVTAYNKEEEDSIWASSPKHRKADSIRVRAKSMGEDDVELLNNN